MNKLILSILGIGLTALSSTAAPGSILDIKHSIKDDNVIAPESFEIKSRELEENFYLKHYGDKAQQPSGKAKKGNAKEYELLLSQLPAEIELPYNSIVGKFIDMYLDKRRTLVADMLALDNYYGEIFVEELIKENMPMELQYLPVIESALNPNAVSKAGAAGLWQIMPKTATGLGLEVNSLVDQRRDPYLSTRHAVKYLKQLYDIYGDWSLAIAAYNCGPGNVNKALKRAGGGKKDYWEIYAYLPAETRGYVPAFIAANFVMNYYDRYGIRPTLLSKKLVTDSVLVDKRVHFNQIAEVLNIPIEEIRMLNPQFRKDIIPGDNHPYALTLPSQQVLSYIMSEQQILEQNADAYARRTYVEPGENNNMGSSTGSNNELSSQQNVQQTVTQTTTAPKTVTHTVGRGENLRGIANKYGVSATDIKRWNQMRSGKVKEGTVLTIEVPGTTTVAANTSSQSVAERTQQKRDDASLATASPANVSSRPISNPGSRTTAQTSKANNNAGKNKTTAANSKNNKKNTKATPKSYKVKKGDSLEKIARANKTTVKALQSANGLKGTKIIIGQTLKIPKK